VPALPEYEPDELMLEDERNTAFYELLASYSRTLRCGELMWQHHFELLLLGYGAYVTFSDFCKSVLPDIPDQHVAQMLAGIDVLLFRPSEELARERDRLAQEYGALLDEETRTTFHELLGLSRMVFPYVEEHKFFCDYWFLTRWWNKVREFGALLAAHGFLDDAEDVFHLGRHEVSVALDELLLTWATGGLPRGPTYWPPIVARRRELLERLAGWTPPPALGATPEAITGPMSIMLWGVTTPRVPG